ncbi:hypothetical protein ACH5RR_021627 [Cinchona calisaya]|uniref:Uncharacterized protein n=1 Tax=Cinchona calisaya TaxID=153742 RepID=A0ABD2ZJ45_9GENT
MIEKLSWQVDLTSVESTVRRFLHNPISTAKGKDWFVVKGCSVVIGGLSIRPNDEGMHTLVMGFVFEAGQLYWQSLLRIEASSLGPHPSTSALLGSLLLVKSPPRRKT